MVKFFALALLLLAGIISNAQHLDKAELHSRLHPEKISAVPHAVHGHPSRNTHTAFSIDYGAVDALYSSVNGYDYYYTGEVPLNGRYSNTDNFTARYVVANYDTLLVADVNNSNTFFYPRNLTQLNLDSFSIYCIYTRTVQKTDTIIISVMNRNTVAQVGTGPSTYVTGAPVWSDTLFLNAALPVTINNLMSALIFFPNIPFGRGETFSIRVEAYGDTANQFIIPFGFRDECANSCAAEPTITGINNFVYFNYTTTSNQNLSGINEVGLDCNADGITGTPHACEAFYFQNPYIFPYVTADVIPSVLFANDTFAFCNGATNLEPIVIGLTPPYSYAWSPSAGLSDVNGENPVVAMPVNPILYTVTVTDVNSQSLTASVLVTPNQQDVCEPQDTFSGRVYSDINNNGQLDAGEPGLSGIFLQASNHGIIQTDSLGDYNFTINRTGSYYINLWNQSPFSFLTQPVTGGYSGASGANHSHLNFGIHFYPDSNNVLVDVSCTGAPPIPGFSNYYIIGCRNVSDTLFTGTLKLTYDSIQSYINAFPTPVLIDTVNRTITWNITHLPGGYNTFCYVNLGTSVNAVLGTQCILTARIIPNSNFIDIDSTDNFSTLIQEVLGSYDPNDKSVSPPGVSAANSILPTQKLKYTIRFQNTGTFFAHFITVTDTIDPDLDINTFEMVMASHKYTLSINGNILTWRFYDIMLPDSNSNEPGSHGYIIYEIKPKATVSNMATINNTAQIYFDYNAPVVTNTTNNTVDYFLGTVGIGHVARTEQVKVYPNPFDNQLNFAFAQNVNNATIKIFDLTGRVTDEIKNVTGAVYQYNTGTLPVGMYTYLITANNESICRGKLVKK